MSTGQECDFWKATDGKWYFFLSEYPPDDDDEDGYEWEDEGTYYGPFDTFESADEFLRYNFANPGSFYKDPSGTLPPPTDPTRRP